MSPAKWFPARNLAFKQSARNAEVHRLRHQAGEGELLRPIEPRPPVGPDDGLCSSESCSG
jgi:hypothetical protein